MMQLHTLIIRWAIFLEIIGEVIADSTQFVTSVSIPSNNLTSNCANALTANVSCNAYVRRFQQGSYFQEQGLEASCTSTCDSGITQWQANIASACANQIYTPDGSTQTPILVIPETVRSNYDLACATENNEFCNVLAKNASLSTSNSSQTVDPCDDCFIKQLQIQVDSPVWGGWQLQSAYSTLTSSCHKTSFPLTTSWASKATTTTTSSSPTCTGKTYQIQPGDTCQSISISQGIGTNWLLVDNSLPAYCSKFPSSGNLCLVNTCKVYTVQANDTCTSIANSWNITEPQLLSWNPVLGISCASLSRNIDSQLCISAPGTPYNGTIVTSAPGNTPAPTMVPAPSDIANGTNTDCAEYYLVQPGDYCNLLTIKFAISLDDFRFLNPSINENCTNLLADESYCVEAVGDIDNYPGHSGYIPSPTSYSTIPWTSFPKATFTPNANVTAIKPFAPGTRLDCVLYVDGSDQYVDPDAGNACQYIADGWGVTLAQLTNWNPSLNGSDPACHFDDELRYCVQAYQALQAAPTTTADPWNIYPIRDGSWTNCSTYEIVTSPETCQDVLDGYEINIAQFYGWNPAVGDQCQNLWPNYRYCVRPGAYVPVSVSASPIVTGSQPSTTSTSPAGTAPPAPTQSGQPGNCNAWVVAKAGDGCDTIENDAGISAATFSQLNPVVGTDCSGLWAGYAYCVGTSGTITPSPSSTTATGGPPAKTQDGEPSTCSKWVVAQSGDSCESVEKAAGIDSATFLKLNPPVGSDCSGLWAGYAYCIAA